VLELAILGLLNETDLHGYELKKRLGESYGLLARGVSFGSLYPALGRLEAAGAVQATPEPMGPSPSSAIPLTGSLTGELAAARAWRVEGRRHRSRKVYRLTDSGRRLFAQLLEEVQPADDDRGFALRLAFARYLRPEDRLGLLERRRAALTDRLTRARQALRAGKLRADAYAAALLQRDTEAAEADLNWLERLIDAERGALDPPTPGSPGDPRSNEPLAVQPGPTRPRTRKRTPA
jgi:DNA-binding PadR family transcriptional regulator